MAVVKIMGFGGMIPATDDRLLPDTAAALTQNCYLYTGQLVGMVAPKFIRNMTNLNFGKTFRLPKNYYDAEHIEDSYWMEFISIDTDVLRSPVTADQYDRYYWASPLEIPQVNSFARITNTVGGVQTPLPSYRLGVPRPTTAPTITSIVGGSGVLESRAYVTTWVTNFKEESAPSNAVLNTGYSNATWNIGLTPPLAADVTNYNIGFVRVYRTVASGGSTSYFYVTEIPYTSTTFADNISSTAVSSNEILASELWTPPPSDLAGFVMMPNGMVAGWRESELWFSEPYRPHAWPLTYVNSVEYPIVGLGVINQTLVVCTAGYPIVATGIHPETITLSKLASFEPCMSRGSILSVPEGVFYASPNGLVLVANGIATLVTEGLIQRDEWNYYNKVATMRATRMGSAYYAFGSERVGFVQPDTFKTDTFQQDDFAGSYKGIILDNANQRVAFNTLVSTDITTNVYNDQWSGETIILRNDKLYRIDLADREYARDTALWRSKIFQSPAKKNFAALRTYFEVPVWASPYNDRVPTMTSSVTSGVTMSADSEYPADLVTTWFAWNAGSDNPLTMWGSDNVPFPHILTTDFGTAPFVATQYAFMGVWPDTRDVSAPMWAPKNWTFEGSNNGSTWVVLDTKVEEPVWTYSEQRIYNVANTTSYRYYRFNVTANYAGGALAPTFITMGMLHINSTAYGTVRVYADNKLILTRPLQRSGELMRLPSGFKADYWQVELETLVQINSIQFATSVKELSKG